MSFILLEGGDPDRVLGLAGVSATALGQPASSLGLDLYCRVMEQAAANTCNGNFGLRYGQQYEPGQLGLLGYVALASPTVGAAFENIGGLFHHHQQRSILRVVRQPELSRIEYQILDRSIAARRQDAELSLGMFFNILRHALGSRWSPEAVLFEHARPDSGPSTSAASARRRCSRSPATPSCCRRGSWTRPCPAPTLICWRCCGTTWLSWGWRACRANRWSSAPPPPSAASWPTASLRSTMWRGR
ncbi:AraC family transcriptional regulator [Achromobacter xylosoxidans]